MVVKSFGQLVVEVFVSIGVFHYFCCLIYEDFREASSLYKGVQGWKSTIQTLFVRAYLTYYYRFEDLMLMVGGVVEILVKFKLFLECFRVQNVCKPKNWTLYRL